MIRIPLQWYLDVQLNLSQKIKNSTIEFQVQFTNRIHKFNQSQHYLVHLYNTLSKLKKQRSNHSMQAYV